MNNQLEQPIYNNFNVTIRKLDPESIQNQNLKEFFADTISKESEEKKLELTDFEDIIPISKESETIEKKEISLDIKELSEKISDDLIEKIDINISECDKSLLSNVITLIGWDKLYSLLSEVLIRFDTSPRNYTKDDFENLLKIIIQLYGRVQYHEESLIKQDVSFDEILAKLEEIKNDLANGSIVKDALDKGIITTGTLAISDGSEIIAGITGQSDSVKVWVGNTIENKETAPLRILSDGTLFAENIHTVSPAFIINDDNITTYIINKTITYLNNDNNLKLYNFTTYNFKLTGNKILLDTNLYNISVINLPIDKDYLGSTIEIYNPKNLPINLSVNVPDIESCNIQNYLDNMIINGYFNCKEFFEQNYYSYPKGIYSINRGTTVGRAAILKAVTNAYRFTVRKRNLTPITKYTYLRFRMIRLSIDELLKTYINTYYHINEDGFLYLWICEEKQSDPKLINKLIYNSKFIGDFS